MILHGKDRQLCVAQPLDGIVVHIRMRHNERRPRKGGRIDGIAVVLRGDVHLAHLQILDGLIAAAMPELHLVRLCAKREREQLMPEADAEDRLLPCELAHLLHNLRHIRRIAGTVREEYSIGIQRKHLLGARMRGHNRHLCPNAVDVLQNALAIDRAEREGITKKNALRETKAFIQIIHKLRDDALTTDIAPVENVAIFDEAQRSWDEESLTDFMKRKKGIPDFNQSEPEFLISIMDRHKDWSVIVCLVGGGQEIYNGEAGIQDWFKTLSDNYSDWKIYLSDKITDTEYVGESDISTLLHGREYRSIPDLHLGVSLRSFRSEKLALFVKLLLDERAEDAHGVYCELKQSYPIYITRDLEIAKKWVKNQARGTERYGLLASSEGKRLRAEGIWVPSTINHVGWFLNGKDNVDSSYYLEVAASEFKVQGLEVDYAILAWDADFRYTTKGFDYFKFRGTNWNHVNKEQRKRYLKNAYRVLLTRARQGLIIYVPEGSDEDPSRNSIYYDRTFQYLKKTGIEEI